MTLPELVFKTTTPAAIEWFQRLDALNREQQRRRTEFVKEMTELFGPSQRDTYERDENGNKKPQELRNLWVRGRGSQAYALDSGYNERPPEDSGWRLDSKDRNWQPKLATAKGKEWRDRLRSLSQFVFVDHLPEIGIPEVVFSGTHMYSPSLEFDAETGALYSGWSTQHVMDEIEAARKKATVEVEWEQMKLSEYVAYREQKEAKGAPEEED